MSKETSEMFESMLGILEMGDSGFKAAASHIRAHVKELERERDEALNRGRREGFQAAREPEQPEGLYDAYVADEGNYAVLDGSFKYASLEHYERELAHSLTATEQK